MNILLVEDNSLDAMMIRRALSKVAPDAAVAHASDGLEALDLLESDRLRPPYFVLLDINMPRMNGHEFLERLRSARAGSDTVVFVFSTSDCPRDIAKAYRQHANGYIVKPHDKKGMMASLATLRDFWELCEPPPKPGSPPR
ncbi:response regulator [Maliponia aquimaris]|nr:response regulator [Maliponia aquimaris]